MFLLFIFRTIAQAFMKPFWIWYFIDPNQFKFKICDTSNSRYILILSGRFYKFLLVWNRVLIFQWAILISSSWKPILVLFCRLKIKGSELPVWIGKTVHTLVDKRRKDWQFCYINNIGPILCRFKVCSTEKLKEYHINKNGWK